MLNMNSITCVWMSSWMCKAFYMSLDVAIFSGKLFVLLLNIIERIQHFLNARENFSETYGFSEN